MSDRHEDGRPTADVADFARERFHRAELEVLGAMCLSIEAANRGSSLLERTAFAGPANRAIFDAIVALAGGGILADVTTLSAELAKRGRLAIVGDIAGVLEIVGYAVTAANIKAHAAIVRDAWIRRCRAEHHAKRMDAWTDPLADVVQLLADDRAADEILSREAAAVDPVAYLDLEAIRENGVPPVPWILPGWLAEGDIANLSGDAYTGKSTLGADIAVSLARRKPCLGVEPTRAYRVLVFDEEQNDSELARMYLRAGAPCEGLRVASQQGIALTEPAGLGRLERELRDRRPEIVMFDSADQVMPGVNQSAAEELVPVYRTLFRLRRDYEVTFLLYGHLPKPNAQSPRRGVLKLFGSIVNGTKVSTAWIAERTEDRKALELRQVKRRGTSVLLGATVHYHSDNDDAPVILTYEPLDLVETRAAKSKAKGQRTRDAVLDALIALGRPATAAEVRERMGAGAPAEPTVRDRLNELIAAGKVSDAGKLSGRGGAKLWIAFPPDAAEDGDAAENENAQRECL